MLSIGDFAQLGQVSPRMLRHYDQLGVLRPERVDPATGYRSAFVRWIEAAGYRLAGGSRELYHDYDPANPDAGVTELQIPIS